MRIQNEFESFNREDHFRISIRFIMILHIFEFGIEINHLNLCLSCSTKLLENQTQNQEEWSAMDRTIL
jgi:hypothetical protein